MHARQSALIEAHHNDDEDQQSLAATSVCTGPGLADGQAMCSAGPPLGRHLDVDATTRRACQPATGPICKERRDRWTKADRQNGTVDGATFANATLRQTLHMSMAAPRIRIQVSNTFGATDLSITSGSVALPANGTAGSPAIDPATLATLTFGGRPSITIAPGHVAYSDPLDFAVAAQSMLSVSLYLADGQRGVAITGHPGSRTTSWMQAGNAVATETLTDASTVQSTVHWYFLTAVEALVPSTSRALVVLGDSITDGRGSTTDANNRWPDRVLAKMQAAGLVDIGVNNMAAGGNAVLPASRGLGPALLDRYRRDAIDQAGVAYVLVFEGVNDIGVGAHAADVIAALAQIAADIKAAGLRVFGATIAPFGGNAYYSEAHEAARQDVNAWILESGTYDATVDFAALLADPENPLRLAAEFDTGDHLHPNVAGYQHLADHFPLDIFGRT